MVRDVMMGGGLPPGAKLITAEQSGHWVQLDQPSIVVDAIAKRSSTSRSSGLTQSANLRRMTTRMVRDVMMGGGLPPGA